MNINKILAVAISMSFAVSPAIAGGTSSSSSSTPVTVVQSDSDTTEVLAEEVSTSRVSSNGPMVVSWDLLRNYLRARDIPSAYGTFRQLVDHGIALPRGGSGGVNIFLAACKAGQFRMAREILNQLMRRGTRLPLGVIREGNTLLHYVGYLGDVEVFNSVYRYMNLRPTDLDVQNLLGETPLNVAVGHEHHELVRVMLARGADGNVAGDSEAIAQLLNRPQSRKRKAPDGDEESDSEESRRKRRKISVSSLAPTVFTLPPSALSASSLVSSSTSSSSSSSSSAEALWEECYKHLLGRNMSGAMTTFRQITDADVGVGNKGRLGLTIFSIALQMGSPEFARNIIEYLHTNQVDVNQQDLNGNTALHQAVRHDAGRVVEFLIQRGVRLDIVDSRGETPQDLAQRLNRIGIVAQLLAATQQSELDSLILSSPTSIGLALLMIAAKESSNR
jgi:ankyrin repeat protein